MKINKEHYQPSFIALDTDELKAQKDTRKKLKEHGVTPNFGDDVPLREEDQSDDATDDKSEHKKSSKSGGTRKSTKADGKSQKSRKSE